ncbi:MAG: hypothetical protein ACI4LC_02240 [Emergencia sp.]
MAATLEQNIKQNNTNRQNALNAVDKTYDNIISQSDQYYQAQIDQVNNYAEIQKQNQQAMTDQAINVINQQKEQANKDYAREQSGAYVDWQKQSNAYGADAEKMAASGLAGTGYSESSQVSMFNTYQNRVATARETYNRAVLNYDNAIKDAMLQNNVKLAEIANQALTAQLELSLAGFQYKNDLLREQLNMKQQIKNEYNDRAFQYASLDLDRQNAALAQKQYKEDVRQFDKNYALSEKQLKEDQRQFNLSYGLKSTKTSGGSSGKSSGSNKTSGKIAKTTTKKTTKSGGASIKKNTTKKETTTKAPAKITKTTNKKTTKKKTTKKTGNRKTGSGRN